MIKGVHSYGLPLICAHQGFDEHRNIQCKQERQDLVMPNPVQLPRNQHIYHSQ